MKAKERESDDEMEEVEGKTKGEGSSIECVGSDTNFQSKTSTCRKRTLKQRWTVNRTWRQQQMVNCVVDDVYKCFLHLFIANVITFLQKSISDDQRTEQQTEESTSSICTRMRRNLLRLRPMLDRTAWTVPSNHDQEWRPLLKDAITLVERGKLTNARSKTWIT